MNSSKQRLFHCHTAMCLSNRNPRPCILQDTRPFLELGMTTLAGKHHPRLTIVDGEFDFASGSDAEQPAGLKVDLLRRCQLGPFFRSFSLNSYGYSPQTIEKLSSICHAPRYDHFSPTGC